ncbi:MAG: ECF transporter S component [Erysipelotrichaceae bacterium]
MKKKLSTKKIALIGLLGGLGAVLMYLQCPLPFMPPFLSFDLAAVPELIGAFALGPVASILIVLVKMTIQLLLKGTNSMMTGELQGLLLNLAFVLPVAIIYKRNKTKKGAIIGLACGSLACTLTSVFTNLYIIIPFYVNLNGMAMDQIIKSCTLVNPYMNSLFTMAILGIAPFNLIKCLLNALVTLILYKKISPIIHKYANNG